MNVSDGDSVTFFDGQGIRYKLRLAGIDAPEAHMPNGQQARQYLASLVLGKEVVAHIAKQDKYGRYIATIALDGADVNMQMLQAGLAWHYTKYAKEQAGDGAALYLKAEQTARARAVGLWRDANPIAPWDWRVERKRRVLDDEGREPTNEQFHHEFWALKRAVKPRSGKRKTSTISAVTSP